MKAYASEMVKRDSVFKDIAEKQETLWLNDKYLPFDSVDALCQLIVSEQDIEEAEKRLERFAPYIMECFPETNETKGIIESPLVRISAMQKQLEKDFNTKIPGQLLLKLDSHLAIAGSVKARGGIYEVLKHAEDLALEAGLINPSSDYSKLADKECRDFFSQYTVQVGSTGNLGLSIGIMSAAIGFKVKVHMSADAKQWKKDLLRSKGVEVIEYDDDYSKAVQEGRRLSQEDPKSYFVDDEYSVALFLGYAVAAKRLKKQLIEMKITVDEQHPLIVYIPCGVGGAPGGILYGLKRIFGDNVHVFFCEPVLFPSVLIGMASDLYEKANVADFDIHGMSEADGLACASPSGFVTRIDRNLLSGDFTIQDEKLYTFMRTLMDTENIRIEPSSCAAFIGPVSLTAKEKGVTYLADNAIDRKKLENATQICWATGGKLVPEEVWQEYLKH